VSQTLNVHVRVNDAATGQPTPVRIRFAGPNGEYFPPLGRSAEFPTGRNEDVGGSVYLSGQRFAYIDGACEVPLPTSVPLSIEITKGIEYIPIRETIALGEGQLSLRFAIERWTDERFGGFVHVDSRCHFIASHAAKLEAMAEGIDIANLLIVAQDYPSNDGHMYRVTPNMTAFSGQTAAIDRVFVNTFNVHPALGRLGLLNCHRPVFPLTFGHIEETDDWSLADWCDQCHRKKGLVVWCDAYRPEAGLPGGEALVESILGRIDAFEIDASDRKSPFLPMWYQLLNAGIRLPLVGGSGKDSNRIAIGSMRTLTSATERSYSEWIESVRRGATVASNAPFVGLRVNGQPLGSPLTQLGSTLQLEASAASLVPFERLELIVDGEVVAGVSGRPGDITTAKIEVEHLSDNCGWIAARCWGPPRPELYPQVPVFAHTSPIFIDRSSRSLEAVARFTCEIATVRQWVERDGRFANPRRKEHLLSLCDAATSKLSAQS
jgi:hypothetical protein